METSPRCQTSSSATPTYLSVDGLTQECRDLLPTLPSEVGWHGNLVYCYQGTWLSVNSLQGSLNFQNHFQAQDGDIIVVTSPKSGTTWLKALTFAIATRTHHRRGFQDHPLLQTSPHNLVPMLELRLYMRDQNPDLTRFPPPRIFCTHLPYVLLPESVKRSSCKIVYMSRNPKDTFVSAWHFENLLRPQEVGKLPMDDYFAMFCRGVSPYGPFWEHVSCYWEESLQQPHRVLFLRYEETKERPVEVSKKLAEFLGFPFSEEEEKGGVVDDIVKLCSFDNLSNLELNKTERLSGIRSQDFYRKGEVGDWKNYLSEEMEKQLNNITEEKWCDGLTILRDQFQED